MEKMKPKNEDMNDREDMEAMMKKAMKDCEKK